jgi:4-amino-4-deoxy-L-arabinose transferase-like glycosyltransferase
VSAGRESLLARPSRRASTGLEAAGFARSLGLVIAGAVLLRVLYTVFLAPWPPEVSDDQVFFNLMPQVLADGKGYIQPQLALMGQTFDTASHPPLYPYLLAGPAWIGLDGDLFQRLTGTLFGAVTVLCTGLLGRRLAGDRAGLIAAAIAAVYPILITADGALMSESLYGALVGLALLAAYRVVDEPTVWRAALLGALIGLGALARGEGLLLLLLLLVPIVRRPGGVRAAAVVTLAAVVVLTPWTIRNWVTFDRLVLVSTNAGAVIGGANCPTTYSGENIGGWDFGCARPTPGKNEAEQTAIQMDDGLEYANDHLRRLPVVMAVRLLREWSFFRPTQINPGRDGTVQNIGLAFYFGLLPLAVWGFVVLRRRRTPTWLIVSPVVMVSITAVLFFGFLRFRHPAEISLVVLGGVAVDALLRRRERVPVRE